MSDLAQLPRRVYLDLGGSDNDINDAIQLPHYPKAGTPAGGPDGSVNIIDAWGGAAWDFLRQRMHIGSGGHGDAHECETGVYTLDAATLRVSRSVDRQPLSMVQSWNFTTHQLEPVSRGNAASCPLINGVPPFTHTYDGLIWLPPGTPGAGPLNGGLFIPGQAKGVVNLDDGTYSTTHWNNPETFIEDWSYCMCFLHGNVIYRPYGSWLVETFDLSQRQMTDWSKRTAGGPDSLGKLDTSPINMSVPLPYSAQTFVRMRERGEFAVIVAGGAKRVRYVQAIAGAPVQFGRKDWTSYIDVITFTSDDGSHADFSAAAMADDGALCDAGVHYDHDNACIWYQGSKLGGALYKITNLDTLSWKIAKVPGVAARYDAHHGTYGRFAVATFGTVKLGLRVSATAHPVQVVRLDE